MPPPLPLWVSSPLRGPAAATGPPPCKGKHAFSFAHATRQPRDANGFHSLRYCTALSASCLGSPWLAHAYGVHLCAASTKLLDERAINAQLNVRMHMLPGSFHPHIFASISAALRPSAVREL